MSCITRLYLIMITSSNDDNDFLTLIEASATLKIFITKKYDQFQQTIRHLQNQLTSQRSQTNVMMQEFFSAKSLKLYFIKIISKKSIKYIDNDYWTWENHILDMKNQFEVNDVDEAYRAFSNLTDKKKIEYVYEFLNKIPLNN